MINNIEDALTDLNSIEQDNSVPKSIRSRVRTAILALNENGKPAEVKIDKALQELDEISDDPNIPQFTRTQIWNIVSILSMMDK